MGGQKKIRRPGITDDNCRETRYQPKFFTTDEFSECMYSKSLCSEEGQVIVNNGSSGFSDRTCRCDYRAGYTYIVEPRNKCECVPSEEDCSCYRKLCIPGEELSIDYKCRVKDSVYLSTCNAITGAVNGDSENIAQIPLKPVKKTDSNSISHTAGGKAAAGLVTLLIFLAVRPHVSKVTVNIDETYLIYIDEKYHVYDVIEGCKLSVDCTVNSRLPVKSVKMVKVSPQTERSNIAVKSVRDKRRHLDEILGICRGVSNRLSSTDTGIYRCMVTNGLPLPFNNSDVLNSFLAKGYVLKYMTDFPPFSPEKTNRITICVHALPLATDIAKEFTGHSITFTAEPETKRRILSVKWVKVEYFFLYVKLRPLPHDGTTSFSIDTIKKEDSGDYVCFIKTDDQTVLSHRYTLKVIHAFTLF